MHSNHQLGQNWERLQQPFLCTMLVFHPRFHTVTAMFVTSLQEEFFPSSLSIFFHFSISKGSKIFSCLSIQLICSQTSLRSLPFVPLKILTQNWFWKASVINTLNQCLLVPYESVRKPLVRYAQDIHSAWFCNSCLREWESQNWNKIEPPNTYWMSCIC